MNNITRIFNCLAHPPLSEISIGRVSWVLDNWHSIWKRFKTICLSEIAQQDKSSVIASDTISGARQSKSGFCGLLRHFIPRNDNRVAAFTLAEVLITLMIIGVIAVLTIPNLIKKYEHKEYEAGFKKAWAKTNEVVKMANQELGVNNIAKDCSPNYTEAITTLYKYFNIDTEKTEYINSSWSYYTFNGNSIPLYNYAGTDNAIGWGHIYKSGNTLVHISNARTGVIRIVIDSNGIKKPNRQGYDIWMFDIYDEATNGGDKGGIRPFYSGWPCQNMSDLYNYCTRTKADNHGRDNFTCGYWALINKNPDNQTQSYWDGLD